MSHGSDQFATVLNALAAQPDTEFGQPGAVVEVLRQVDGPFSSVQRVRITTPTRTVHAYTKILKPRRPGPDELASLDRMLKREYNATAALYQALRTDDDIGSVRPMAFLPELRALVTEEVPGRPLGELLEDDAVPEASLLAVARRIGQWVRLYQQVLPATGRVVMAERRDYLDARLRLLEPRVISTAEHAFWLGRFDSLQAEMGQSDVVAVPIHADLGPMNIIVEDSGRVTVLDFTMAKTGTIHHDLSHVYFHFELLAMRHRRQRARVSGLQRAMLDGYRPGLSSADPLFQLMLLAARGLSSRAAGGASRAGDRHGVPLVFAAAMAAVRGNAGTAAAGRAGRVVTRR